MRPQVLREGIYGYETTLAIEPPISTPPLDIIQMHVGEISMRAGLDLQDTRGELIGTEEAGVRVGWDGSKETDYLYNPRCKFERTGRWTSTTIIQVIWPTLSFCWGLG
jgi:hypothetical protein